MGKMGSSEELLKLNSKMNETYMQDMLKNGGAPSKEEIFSFANIQDKEKHSDLK